MSVRSRSRNAPYAPKRAMEYDAHRLPYEGRQHGAGVVPSEHPRLARHAPRVRRLREKRFIFASIIPHSGLRRNRWNKARAARSAECRHAASVGTRHRSPAGRSSTAPGPCTSRAGKRDVRRRATNTRLPLRGATSLHFDAPDSDDRASPCTAPSVRTLAGLPCLDPDRARVATHVSACHGSWPRPCGP